MPDTATVGREVRLLRKRVGWTQDDLAKSATVSRNTIVGLEGGEKATDVLTLSAIVGALGAEAHRQSVDNQQLRVLSDTLLRMVGLPPIAEYGPDGSGGADVGETRVEFDRALVQQFGEGMGRALARLALNWEHLAHGQGVVIEHMINGAADVAADAAAMNRRRPLSRVSERRAGYANGG